MPKIDLEAIEALFPWEGGNYSDARLVIKRLIARVRELEAEVGLLNQQLHAGKLEQE